MNDIYHIPEQALNPPEPKISEAEMERNRQRLIADIMDALDESKLSDYIEDDLVDMFDAIHAITQDRDDDKLGRINDVFWRYKLSRAEYLADTANMDFRTDRTLQKMKVSF